MLNFESGVGKNGALAGLFVLCAMNAELVYYQLPFGRARTVLIRSGITQVWNKTSKILQLKQEILVVHHNVILHFGWAAALSLASLVIQDKSFFICNVVTCLITSILNLCFYQPPKNAKTWKQAMDESSECPFAAEARRKQYSQAEFEKLRLSYHKD